MPSSPDIVQEYLDMSSDAGFRIDHLASSIIERTVTDEHFGFVFQDNLVAATRLIKEGGNHLPLEDLPVAMGSLAILLRVSGHSYRSQSLLPDDNTWNEHVQAVREGRIELLQDQAWWMTPRRSRAQAQRADKELGRVGRGVEQILAALNYEIYFRPQTMAGHARILAESPEIAATEKGLAEMPHLSVTNWSIGQGVQHVYEQMAQQSRGNLYLLDMCSGTAATLAASVNRLSVAQSDGVDMGDNRLGVLGFEATPAFFEQMRVDFLPTAQPKLDKLGVKKTDLTDTDHFHHQPRTGEITLVEGDVVEAIEGLDFSEISPDDVVVATANYGFHRLPAARKVEIMKSLSRAENSIMLVGDLRQNGSAVNRGYFNLANNGPLNAGNIDLEMHMRLRGYEARTVGVKGFEPNYVAPILRSRLAQELHNDGFVTIAAKGQRAAELVFTT